MINKPLHTSTARTASTLATVSLLALILAGCAVGPDYQRPPLDLPQQWRAADATSAASTRTTDSAGDRWWSLYADPVLDRLIDEALAHNADAAVAAARVLEVRAQTRSIDADRYPALSAGLSGNRTKSSTLGTFPIGGLPRTQSDYRATLDASYEVDLWGKYSRASESARADLFAAESARQSVRLSLAAEVVRQYFALLAADAQVLVAQRTQASRDETITLFAQRVDAGTLAEFTLNQAQAEAAQTRSQLAALQQAQDRSESALALLLGRSPRAIIEQRVERDAPGESAEFAERADESAPSAELVIPAGLPSELLLRRPDLREAEARLIASNALIGAARAQYFPSVGLTAYLGGESTAFSTLFSGPAGIFQFAAGITQPLWNAGRIGAGVDAAQARHEQMQAQYQKAVASAFKDLRDALAAQNAARQTLAAESTRTVALVRSLKQARQRFDAGIASQLEVLDVERNLLAAKLARIDAERARKAALADLFKALGGGWTTSEGV
jgi:multidrug efflux system outer membrane protein